MALKARPQLLKVSSAKPLDRGILKPILSMAFFRTVTANETMPAIAGPGVTLRAPQSGDHGEWAALRETSRAFLVPWEPTWPSDDLTRGAFRRRLKRYAEDARSDLAYAFLIFRSEDNALVGGLTLANIRRGVAQAGSIGYWIGAPFARKGYMTAAMRALVPFCFGSLRLHRLEAACIPANAASVHLLEKAGFQREGYARSYLCINGIWQDHLLYARLKDDPDSA
jgi:ribosomal-protein-alanine N-acetyltransferase